jgi:hypothetical protein
MCGVCFYAERATAGKVPASAFIKSSSSVWKTLDWKSKIRFDRLSVRFSLKPFEQGPVTGRGQGRLCRRTSRRHAKGLPLAVVVVVRDS